MALYATCMPLPSDTFHDKLFACDQGGHPDYDHDREEVLWLLLAALFSLRLRKQCDPGQRQRVTQCALARAGRACATFYKHWFVCSSQPSTTNIVLVVVLVVALVVVVVVVDVVVVILVVALVVVVVAVVGAEIRWP